MIKKLDIEYLRECLDYDPNTGICTWKTRPLSHFKSIRMWNKWNSKFSGKRAGGKKKRKNLFYDVLWVSGGNWPVHRVAWAISTGEWPNQIDHIDGNGLNNRLSNLRCVTTLENMKNKKKYANRELPSGVYKYGNSKRYCAKIQVNGRLMNLGTFDSISEAAKVRKEAETNLGFSPRHGT